MALQSSGQIKMSQLNTELNRGATDEFSISLAVEGGYEAINTSSTNKPNHSAPHTISEWYSYDHNAS